MNPDRYAWHTLPFEQLTTDQLYQLLQLRQAVFVVEQACAYLDADQLDLSSLHIFTTDSDQHIIAYARVTPPASRFTEPSIGRVAVSQNHRRQGLGQALMQYVIRTCQHHHPQHDIRISAQAQLDDFYQRLGFQQCSEPYLEDGIPHIEMLLKTTPTDP